MGRLIIVSNRLPFSIDRSGDSLSIRQSSGGLVSALKSYFEANAAAEHETSEKIWFGVADFPQQDWEIISREHLNEKEQEFTLEPIFIDKPSYDNYYNGFSNSVIWPLFHYFTSLARYETRYFDAYVQVNKNFAERLLAIIRPGDTIWIHDYQLMLLPGLIRSKIPSATIGFFMHIPFPSYEIFRLLPKEWKKTILHGLMGADLIGFHIHDYVRHFMQSVKMVLGADNYFHMLQYQSRLVKVDLFPIGIDYNKFNLSVRSNDVINYKNEVKKNFEGKKIVFSVDRLDYTKGLMHRLNGIEYFLDHFPEWKEKMVFILNLIPSRNNIQAYHERKKLIEEKVGTVNGKFSSISWQPVIYRYNHLSFTELLGLYQSADAALITPLRDGMNLVAKEYVASCADQRGVLILSEFAGAASELNESLLVNPTDVVDVSSAIAKALTMPAEEQQHRLALMQKRLQDYDVVKWVNDFMDQLHKVKEEQKKQQVKFLDDKITAMVKRQYNFAEHRCLLLDYDGTLVPFARTPSEASPDSQVRELLAKLSADPKNDVVIISGRDVPSLDSLFGHLPITLVAEHGADYRKKNEQWQQVVPASSEWKDQVRPIMQLFTMRCVGSFIEEKTNTIAWHYRNTHPDLGFTRSRELMHNLSELVQNTSLQVLEGNKVIEVRMAGFDKGITARKMLSELPQHPDFVLCIGDDTTDEDMFKALANDAFTIKVGYGATAAHYSILSQHQVLSFLNDLMRPMPLATQKEVIETVSGNA